MHIGGNTNQIVNIQIMVGTTYIINSYVYQITATDWLLHIPYSGLFSLGANFSKFHEWVHNLGKFILGY